jgi:RNA polymerase sigma-70 factor, ECF subfamily
MQPLAFFHPLPTCAPALAFRVRNGAGTGSAGLAFGLMSRLSAPIARPDRAADPAAGERAQRAERAERDARLAALVAAAARGDTTAFEAFYDATLGAARCLARRVLGSLAGSELDDLLAEVYFEAWRNAARFDAARGSAIAWLLTLVRSRSIDALRSRAAQPLAQHAEADDSTADPGPDPAERLWQSQAGSRLHAALAGLSAAERWALGLAYFRELSHREIAAATGWPLGTVKSHLLRAQGKLRAALAAA